MINSQLFLEYQILWKCFAECRAEEKAPWLTERNIYIEWETGMLAKRAPYSWNMYYISFIFIINKLMDNFSEGYSSEAKIGYCEQAARSTSTWPKKVPR